eukprot:gene11972-biopygen8118
MPWRALQEMSWSPPYPQNPQKDTPERTEKKQGPGFVPSGLPDFRARAGQETGNQIPVPLGFFPNPNEAGGAGRRRGGAVPAPPWGEEPLRRPRRGPPAGEILLRARVVRGPAARRPRQRSHLRTPTTVGTPGKELGMLNGGGGHGTP